jgi:hypothetical protein
MEGQANEKTRARRTLRLIRMIIWHGIRGHLDEVEECLDELRDVTRKRGDRSG